MGALCVISLPVSAAVAQWVAQPDVPGARQEVSYVQVGGKFYLAGNGTTHQKFDPQTGQWTNVAPLPVSGGTNLDHIQGVAYGGKIYYIGGLTSWPNVEVGTVYIYDPATNTFDTGTPMPRPRGAGGVAVHDGKIYYAGGLQDGIARQLARRLRPRDGHLVPRLRRTCRRLATTSTPRCSTGSCGRSGGATSRSAPRRP